MSEAGYPIRAVSQMTGLSQHAIRAWEKRYGVVEPDRTGTNRRLYSVTDVERLKLFKRASELGHSLTQLSGMANDAIQSLIGPMRLELAVPGDDLAAEAVRASIALDADRLETVLEYAFARDGADGVIDHVVVPLLRSIDRQWMQGTLSIAQEHTASAVLRPFLHRARRALQASPSSPKIAIATLPGEIHEIGALLAALVAAGRNWRVLFLGPSLPISEIASAAHSARVNAVGISAVSPRENLEGELTELRQLIGDQTEILLGGREAKNAGRISRLNIHQFNDLDGLRAFLDARI